MTRRRILLVDDHELFRQGLAGLLDQQPDLEVVGQGGDGFEAVTLARQSEPDLIVMDVSMPICNGLEATRRLRAMDETAAIPILILTIHDEDEKLFEAIRAGATGYLLKSSSSGEFLRGVRAALAGEGILPPKLAARLMDEFARLAAAAPASPDGAPAHAAASAWTERLTPREHEVLRHLAAGASDREIAAALAVSLHTVKSHVRNILGKLHAANRRAAVAQARRRGLL